jgi:hypothetical protein
MIDIINSLIPNANVNGNSEINILDIISKNKDEWSNAFKKFHTLSKTNMLSILSNDIKDDTDNLDGGAQAKRDILKGKSIQTRSIMQL